MRSAGVPPAGRGASSPRAGERALREGRSSGDAGFRLRMATARGGTPQGQPAGRRRSSARYTRCPNSRGVARSATLALRARFRRSRVDAELGELAAVEDEGTLFANAHFLHDHHFFRPGPSQPEVDPYCCEDDRDESAINLGGVGTDEVLELDQLQQRNQQAADRSVEESLFQAGWSVLCLVAEKNCEPCRIRVGSVDVIVKAAENEGENQCE